MWILQRQQRYNLALFQASCWVFSGIVLLFSNPHIWLEKTEVTDTVLCVYFLLGENNQHGAVTAATGAHEIQPVISQTVSISHHV